MKEHNFLKIVIVILLGINIAVISFLLLSRKNHHRHRGPAGYIIEQLHLTKEQQAQYQLLISKHRADIAQYDRANIFLKTELYAMSLGSHPDSIGMAKILGQIGQNQIAIEEIHLVHLSGIQKICGPEQKKNFDLLIKEFPELFSRKNPLAGHKHPH